MMFLIPIAIVAAFSIKGSSLYFARSILIKVGNEVVKTLQTQLSSCVLKSDINTIESKHSGKYIAHFFYDVGQVSQLVSSGVLNLMKDKGLDDVLLVGGGIIPKKDIAKLEELGMGKLFGPGTPVQDTIDYITDWIDRNRR